MLDIEDDKVADKLHKMVVDNVVEEVADKVGYQRGSQGLSAQRA